MCITEKDYKVMKDFLDKGLNAVLEEAVPEENDHYVFPIGIYLGCSRSMALEMYKFAKPKKVYFQDVEGLWLLDQKGELNLIKKRLRPLFNFNLILSKS